MGLIDQFDWVAASRTSFHRRYKGIDGALVKVWKGYWQRHNPAQ